MKTHVLRGSKQEIVDNLARISGEVREAIVFEKDPPTGGAGQARPTRRIFLPTCDRSWLMSRMSDHPHEAIYTRMEGE